MNAWLPNDDLLKVFDWEEVFDNRNRVEIELGAGDGGFILQYAPRNPQTNFVAIERLLGRARKITKHTEQAQMANLRTLRLESHYFVQWMCPPQSVSCVHIMFPDPWPKRKHFKNRLIQPDFLIQLLRILKTDGEVRFTTDHLGYFEYARKAWRLVSGWQEMELWDYSTDPLTDFQKAFDAEGRSTYRMRWRKM